MNRKGIMSPGIIIALLVGLFFIGIVVVGFGPKILAYVNEKFFGGFFVPETPAPPGTVAGPSEFKMQTIQLSGDYNEAIRQMVDTSLACWQAWQAGYKGICAQMIPAARISRGIEEAYYGGELYEASDLGKVIHANARWDLGIIGSGAMPFFICVRYLKGPIMLSTTSIKDNMLFLTRNQNTCTGEAPVAPPLPVIKLSGDASIAIKELENAVLTCWMNYNSNNFAATNCFRVEPPSVLLDPVTRQNVAISVGLFVTHMAQSEDPVLRDIAGAGTLDEKNYQWLMEFDNVKGGGKPFYLCGGYSWPARLVVITTNEATCK